MNDSTETMIFSLKYSLVTSVLVNSLQPYICSEMASQSAFCTQFEIFPRICSTVICTLLVINIQLIAKQFHFVKIVSCLRWLTNMPFLIKFGIFGTIFHTISVLSSSFIEEEHQFWYYLNSTFLVLLYLFESKNAIKSPNIDGKMKKTSTNADDSKSSFCMRQIGWILLFSGHLIGRRLNQTGDKWLNIPDIGDWLQMDEHRLANSFFTTGSLLLLHISCLDFGSILTNVLTLTACMLIYYYRTLKGSVYFAGIKASE